MPQQNRLTVTFLQHLESIMNGLWERTKEKLTKQPPNGKNAEEYEKKEPKERVLQKDMSAVQRRQRALDEVMKGSK